MITKIEKPLSNDYEVEEIIPGIYSINNFINDDELFFLNNIIANASTDDWGKDYVDSLKEMSMHACGTEDYRSCAEKGLIFMNEIWLDKSLSIPGNTPIILRDRIKRLFSNYNVSLDPLSTIQRHYPGSYLDEHVDSENDPRVVYAVVIYLNDNFNGGEIYFPLKNIAIKPKQQSMLLFDSTSDFIHGVKEVLPGPTRYAMTGFIYEIDV
jgi:hypothetical protein